MSKGGHIGRCASTEEWGVGGADTSRPATDCTLFTGSAVRGGCEMAAVIFGEFDPLGRGLATQGPRRMCPQLAWLFSASLFWVETVLSLPLDAGVEIPSKFPTLGCRTLLPSSSVDNSSPHENVMLLGVVKNRITVAAMGGWRCFTILMKSAQLAQWARILDFRQFDFGQLAEVEIGQNRNWLKSKLAEVEQMVFVLFLLFFFLFFSKKIVFLFLFLCAFSSSSVSSYSSFSFCSVGPPLRWNLPSAGPPQNFALFSLSRSIFALFVSLWVSSR